MPKPTSFSPIHKASKRSRQDKVAGMKLESKREDFVNFSVRPDEIVPTSTPYIATAAELEKMRNFFQGIDFESSPEEHRARGQRKGVGTKEKPRRLSLEDELANIEDLLEDTDLDPVGVNVDDLKLKGKRRRSGGSRSSVNFSFSTVSSNTRKVSNLSLAEGGRKDSLLSKLSKLFTKSNSSLGSFSSLKKRSSRKPERKRIRRVSRDNRIVLQTGQWTAEEEAVLLHFARQMTYCELRVIAEAVQDYGLKRAQRAMDKKLKRLLKFKSWKHRVPDEIVLLADEVINSSPGYQLDNETLEKISCIAKKFTVRQS